MVQRTGVIMEKEKLGGYNAIAYKVCFDDDNYDSLTSKSAYYFGGGEEELRLFKPLLERKAFGPSSVTGRCTLSGMCTPRGRGRVAAIALLAVLAIPGSIRP